MIAGLDPGGEKQAVALFGGAGRRQRATVGIPLAALEGIIDRSGAAQRIEACCLAVPAVGG